MQAIPALPWAAGSGGALQLAEPVTFDDLVAGKIVITATPTGPGSSPVTLEPVEGSSNLFYKNGSDQICLIDKFTGSRRELTILPSTESSNYAITGIRLGEPMHQFEVYTDTSRSNRPVMGEKYNTLYVAINKDVDSAKNFSGNTDYQKLSVTGTPGEFTLIVYVDFASESGSLEKGQLIECTVPQLIEITSEPLCSFGDIVYV